MDVYKTTVNTPINSCNKVRQAMGKAGAGAFGEYLHCSFSVRGVGRSIPSNKSNPTIGQVETLNHIEEEKIETFCLPDMLESVIKAIKTAHPYEEPAITAWRAEFF